jgi:DNA-binding beta-propeller fold protein YncE
MMIPAILTVHARDAGKQMRAIPAGKGLLLVLLLAVATLFAGCSTVTTSPAGAAREIFWPAAPFEPRIQWVKGIHNRQDAGIEKGFWNKVMELVAGEEKDGISKPYGIYVDAEGRLFVADAGKGVVHEFNRKDNEYVLIGTHGKKALQAPIALTGDDAGNLYITDSAASTVFRYSLRDNALTPFIEGILSHPTGIAYHVNKRLLYITDTYRHQIVVFDLQGQERFRIGSRGESPGYFNYPTDLCLDSSGDLYITDALNARIQVFSADGRYLRMFGTAGDSAGYFAKPKGVGVDSEGHIYVSDAIQDSVQIFDASGILMLVFGESGNGAGQFWMPSGVFIDKSDTIYVGDSYNQRIQIFRYLKSTEDKPELQGPGPSKRSNKMLTIN